MRRFALAPRRFAASDVAWLGAGVTALALVPLLVWVAPPVADWIPPGDGPVFSEWQGIVAPEQLETVRVAIAVAAGFVLAGLVLGAADRDGDRRLDSAIVVLQLLLVGLVIVGVVEQERGTFIAIPVDYFEPLLLGVPVLAGGAVLGAAFAIFAKARSGALRPLMRERRPRLRWELAAAGGALLATAVWLLPALFTDSNLTLAGPITRGHVPLQAQDYFAVVNGRTPLVDYVGQYAHLLPLAVEPLLRTLDLSIGGFTAVMAALSAIALGSIFLLFRAVTGRAFVSLALYVPFLALALYPWSTEGPQWDYNGSYFAFFPGRYMALFLLAGLLAASLTWRRPGPGVLFFVAGLGALNNAEFGIPGVVALTVALLLARGVDESLGTRLRHLLLPAGVGLLGALGVVCAITVARSGELPDLGLLTYYSRQFARYGYGLDPMPLLGLHIAVYATFIAALATAAIRCVHRYPDRVLTASLAYVGALGLLSANYFGGRSLPWQLMVLFPLWGLALALLAWSAWLYLTAEGARSSWRRLAIPVVAVMAAFGVMVAAITRTPAPWSQFDRHGETGPPIDPPELVAFVDDATEPGEAVLLLGTAIDHRLAERAGIENVSPWNSAISLFSEREAQRAIDQLEQAGGSKVIVSRGGVLSEVLADDGSFIRFLNERGFRHTVGDPADPLGVFER
jgi:hypothetical protein